MKRSDLDLLADPEHLRAFVDVLACSSGRSELTVLRSIAAIAEREQRRQADDLKEVLRFGRIRQVAASETARLVNER